MKIIDVQDLVNHELNIGNITVLSQSYIHNRGYSYFAAGWPKSCFSYILAHKAEIRIKNGKTFIANKGDIVYYPEGSRCWMVYYHREITPEPQPTCMSIELHITDNNMLPVNFAENPCIIIKNADFENENFFRKMLKIYNNPQKNVLMLKSIFYEFLYSTYLETRNQKIFSNEVMDIAAGIDYIENNISYDVTVKELAKMCNMSESNFRRIFVKYSGVSPTEYKNILRIAKAKELLRNTNISISEISVQLGFYDSSYFTKVFYKRCGLKPGEYRKRYRE